MSYCGAEDSVINSFAHMSELALSLCLPSGSRHLISALRLDEGKYSKISGDNWYFEHTALFQLLGWSIFRYLCVHNTQANWIYEQNIVTWIGTQIIWGSEWDLYIFLLLSFSNKPSHLQSFMEVKEDSTTKNRSMSYANFKKASLQSYSLILLSISFLLFLPQVLPKGYFEIKVSVPTVCCA